MPCAGWAVSSALGVHPPASSSALRPGDWLIPRAISTPQNTTTVNIPMKAVSTMTTDGKKIPNIIAYYLNFSDSGLVATFFLLFQARRGHEYTNLIHCPGHQISTQISCVHPQGHQILTFKYTISYVAQAIKCTNLIYPPGHQNRYRLHKSHTSLTWTNVRTRRSSTTSHDTLHSIHPPEVQFIWSACVR
jgi:hypothetical protein